MWIADTILPWTSLWLYFYELWHATGQWLGGGEHPGEAWSLATANDGATI